MVVLKKIFHLSLVLIIYLLLFVFVNDSHSWLLFYMQIVTMLLTIIYTYKKNSNLLFQSICIFLLLVVIGMIVEKSILKGGLYIIFIPLIFYLTKIGINKKFLLPFIFILTVFNSYFLFPNYFELMKGLNYPQSVGVNINQLNFTDKDGNIVKLNEDDIIIIDFWTTNCGVCFKKFPTFNELALKYHKKKQISFYAINIPIKQDKSLKEISEKIETLDYSFNKLYAVNRTEVEKLLDFNFYPQVFIIKNGKVINTKLHINEKKVIFNNLEYELENIVN